MGDTKAGSIQVLLPPASLMLLPWGSKADTSGHGWGVGAVLIFSLLL